MMSPYYAGMSVPEGELPTVDVLEIKGHAKGREEIYEEVQSFAGQYFGDVPYEIVSVLVHVDHDPWEKKPKYKYEAFAQCPVQFEPDVGIHTGIADFGIPLGEAVEDE